MREFNTTGSCVPDMHYMVDISGKIRQIRKLVDGGKYFTINKARQYGKTTTISKLYENIKDKYTVVDITFEGLGDVAFESEMEFCESFINLVVKRLKYNDVEKNIIEKWEENKTKLRKLEQLSDKITNLVDENNKEIVLIIDEVDKSSNNQMFLNFLGMLRTKFLDRNKKYDKTFKSVILVGVHDVKNLKLNIRNDEEKKLNSPWNIAEDFKVDMSFNANEIATMLVEYDLDYKTGMDIKSMSETIYEYTSGYPFLVSKICKIIHEYLEIENKWSLDGIMEAVKNLLKETNTLFDSLIKNLENDSNLYTNVKDIIIEGIEKTYNTYAYEKGIIYGIFREDESSKITIHNKIFETLIYDYMIAKQKQNNKITLYENRNKFIDKDGNIEMVLVLEKFKELMYEEYRKEDEEFLERQGRLIFLAFIKPIINGTGFYYIETQTRSNKRMDIVITYNKKEYIIELKKWYGKVYEDRGLSQLAEYMEIRGQSVGYAVVFDFRVNKEYKSGWITESGKSIYEVVV